ncbi:MAG TPA: carboxymuconolactone decarboxylase family protein, partial [Puia sp.]
METKRISIQELEPQAFKAMYALEGYLSATGLTKKQKDLIKMRASQMNGCAYCIDMHTKDAIKNGESIQRIFLLNAWRETGIFTDEEKILLAVTEEITLISHHGLTADTYEKAVGIYGNNQLA